MLEPSVWKLRCSVRLAWLATKVNSCTPRTEKMKRQRQRTPPTLSSAGKESMIVMIKLRSSRAERSSRSTRKMRKVRSARRSIGGMGSSDESARIEAS